MASDLLYRIYDPLLEPLERMSLADPSQPLNKAPATIAVDWHETPQAHIFEVDLLGMRKENVKVQIQKGVLEISAKTEEEGGDDKDAIWHILERPVHHWDGTRVRQLRLPGDANVDEVKANMGNDGVLKVCIPKREMRTPLVKRVEIEEVNKEGIGKKIVKSLKGIIAPPKAK
eukprot:Gb_39836 [translate_table: standard]